MIRYAGIGSRETPQSIGWIMYGIAQQLARRGGILRSGRAKGADTYFENGAKSMGGRCELFTAGMAQDKWFFHAAQFHPAWSKCSDNAKALHARNSAIILGPFLNDPVDFVICWTKDGEASGGTGQGLRIADHLRIPIYNLHSMSRLRDLEQMLGYAL